MNPFRRSARRWIICGIWNGFLKGSRQISASKESRRLQRIREEDKMDGIGWQFSSDRASQASRRSLSLSLSLCACPAPESITMWCAFCQEEPALLQRELWGWGDLERPFGRTNERTKEGVSSLQTSWLLHMNCACNWHAVWNVRRFWSISGY